MVLTPACIRGVSGTLVITLGSISLVPGGVGALTFSTGTDKMMHLIGIIELIDIPVGIATEASKRIILGEAIVDTISNMHQWEILSLRTVVDSLSIRKTSKIVIRNFKRTI